MALGLALAAVLPYARVVGHDFVFDDYSRVIENPHVAFGLSWAGLVRLTTLFHASNWHPLTWFSHMVDFELYGSDPAGHHLTSVLLHACNTVLLFVTLTRMTGEAACAALVALLFAVHPLNVETVAWVSERKGVLSTTFWLFSLLAYERYARRRRAGRYLLVAISMALGLTAKGTLVTIPFVLLLLDWWPLRRWPLLEQDAATADGSPLPAGAGAALAIARRRLVLEKLPLLGLSVVGSVLTLVAQQAGGAVQAVATVSLTARLDNTLLAYVQYLVQALWPVRLACFYPHPTIVGESTSGELSLAAIGAAALLAAMTLAAARARSRPYILVGWLWYLGTLIPVVGLVQVGAQAMADRYTYVPMIGIYVALVWGARDAIARWPRSGPVLVTAAAMAVLLCVRLTWTQVGTWKTSVTLYEHALRVTRHNYLAHNNLGNAYLRAGNTEQAEAQLRRALDILPTLASAHNNLGVILLGRGDLTGAEDHFRRASRSTRSSPTRAATSAPSPCSAATRRGRSRTSNGQCKQGQNPPRHSPTSALRSSAWGGCRRQQPSSPPRSV